MLNRKMLVCIAMAVVLAACGGDTTEEATTTPADTTATTVTDETTTTTSATSTPTTSGGDSSSEDGPSAVCLEATQAMAAAMSSYTTGMTDAMTGNLDSEALELAAGQLEAMAEAAPDEIKNDLRVIATELGKFYEALAEIDYEAGAVPTPEQSQELATLAETIDQQTFDAAAAEVDAWFDDNC